MRTQGDVAYLSKPLLAADRRTSRPKPTRYVNGETAQTDAFQQASENSKAVDAKMAEAEVKSTRTPRGKPVTVGAPALVN
jgi:hypothetical protein